MKVWKDLQDLASRCNLCPKLIQEINDFCWLWPAFEAHVSENYYRGEDVPADFYRGESEHFKSDIVCKTETKAQDFVVTRYGLKCVSPDPKFAELAPDNNKNKKIRRSIQKLGKDDCCMSQRRFGLISVVYRIRNNLFHGNKANAGIKPDELELFKHANSLLWIWIQALESE